MEMQEKHSRLYEEIRAHQREDGTVHMSISVSSREALDNVVRNLSNYGEVSRVSRYGPFLDLILADAHAANRFVIEYDNRRGQDIFRDIESIEVPALYKAARFY